MNAGELRARLAASGIRPLKSRGQHFLTDENLARIIADAAGIAAGDRVLEIGTGAGALTRLIAGRGAAVTSFEVDRGLAALARDLLTDCPDVEIVEADAYPRGRLGPELAALLDEWRRAGARVRLAANLPYNIASPLLLDLLETGAVSGGVVTVQDEVALRLLAAPGEDAWGLLPALAGFFASFRRVRRLPPSVFWPRPSVSSAAVAFAVAPDPARGPYGPFRETARAVFGKRRKTLRAALAPAFGRGVAEAALAASGIDSDRRGETLTLGEIGRLAAFLEKKPLSSG